jgi:di/tricarboxylate transporter
MPADLPVAGQRMLAILAFAVVVWITEAVTYETSAIMITSLMAGLIGFSPMVNDPNTLYGTSRALGMALAGSRTPRWPLSPPRCSSRRP